MADLPKDRITPDKPPFSFVGVDCFGPFILRRRRSMVKRYGVLYICLTVRAIHIEVVHSLDKYCFIYRMRRFITRRGKPEQMRSDNGGNFVCGEKELVRAIDDWNQEKSLSFSYRETFSGHSILQQALTMVEYGNAVSALFERS